MLYVCRSPSFDPASPVSATDDIHDGLSREDVAAILTAREGVSPTALIANTLDEEPCDGILGINQCAHFAWRERLVQADEQLGRRHKDKLMPGVSEEPRFPFSPEAKRRSPSPVDAVVIALEERRPRVARDQ